MKFREEERKEIVTKREYEIQRNKNHRIFFAAFTTVIILIPISWAFLNIK